MNFIEAHMIVHDYVDAVAKGANKNAMLCRPKSHLKNTRDEITDSYKLFYGHMIFFNTRTQEEYEQYESIRRMLIYFVDDTFYRGIIQCNETLSQRGLAKLLNKQAIEDAKNKKQLYMNKITNMIQKGPYRNTEIEKFFTDAQDIALNLKSTITEDTPFDSILDVINSYCIKIYNLAGIPMHEYDIDYFYPFSLLRDLCKKPSLSNLFNKYANYINNAY